MYRNIIIKVPVYNFSVNVSVESQNINDVKWYQIYQTQINYMYARMRRNLRALKKWVISCEEMRTKCASRTA